MILSVSMVIKDIDSPSSEDALLFTLEILKNIKIDNENISIDPDSFHPEPNKPWGLEEYIKIYHPSIPKHKTNSGNARIYYAPPNKEGNGSFILSINAPFSEKNNEYTIIVNKQAEFLVKWAHSWIKIRQTSVAHTITSASGPSWRDIQGNSFPRSIGWWTWVSQDIANGVGVNTLLSAPVYKAYELHSGIAWQVSESITTKTRKGLAKELQHLLPENSNLKIKGIVDTSR